MNGLRLRAVFWRVAGEISHAALAIVRRVNVEIAERAAQSRVAMSRVQKLELERRYG